MLLRRSPASCRGSGPRQSLLHEQPPQLALLAGTQVTCLLRGRSDAYRTLPGYGRAQTTHFVGKDEVNSKSSHKRDGDCRRETPCTQLRISHEALHGALQRINSRLDFFFGGGVVVELLRYKEAQATVFKSREIAR